MSRFVFVLALLCVLPILSLFLVGCDCGSGESGAVGSRLGGDDDDFTPPNDNDDDTVIDDDDDYTPPDGPTVRWLLPTAGTTLPHSTVTFQGKYWYLNPNDISICKRITPSECIDKTGTFTFLEETQEFVGSLFLFQGEHTFEVSGETSDKGQVTDSVTFTVDTGGAYIELELSATSIDAGQSVEATARVYDESDNEITDLVTINYFTTPEAGVSFVQNSITFLQGGVFEIEAATMYGGNELKNSRLLFVNTSSAETLELILSDTVIDAGDSVYMEAQIRDINDVTIYANVFFHASPPFGVTFDSNNGTGQWLNGEFSKSGEYEVTGTMVGSSIQDTQILTVLAGPPAELILTLVEPVVDLPIGGTVVVTPIIEVFDANGNVSTAPTTLDITPSGPTIDQGAGTITFDDNLGHGGTYAISAWVTANALIWDSGTLTVNTTSSSDIVFTNPPRGYVATETGLNIEGYVVDCEDTQTLYINGTWTSVTSANTLPEEDACLFFHWQNLPTGLTIINAELKEGAESVAWGSTSILKGPFHPDDAMISGAVFIGLNEAGFTRLGDVANSLIDDMNIEGMIMAMNPVFDEEEEFWGITIASAKATVTGVSLGPLSIDFDISNAGSYLYTEIRLNDIEVEFKVRGSIVGIGYSVSGSVSTDYVQVNANTYLEIAGNGLSVDVSTLDFEMGSLDVDINNFPDDLEDMFEDVVSDMIEDVVSDALQAEVPDILNDLINQIPMDYVFSVDLPSGDTVNANLSMVPQSITTDSNGDAFTFAMDTRVMVDYVSPVPPTMPGSLNTSGSAPNPFGQYIHGTSNDYEMGIFLSDDVFNQALYNVYRAGALSLDLDDVFKTSDLLAALMLPASLIATYPDHEVRFKFRPLLPPVLLIAQPVKDKVNPVPATIQMGDMMIHGSVVDDAGVEQLFLSVAVSFDVDLDIDVPFPTNTLEITMGTPEVVMDIAAEPLGDFNDILIQVFAPYLIEMILPVITNMLQGIEIPMFGDFGIEVLDMTPLGSNSDYITIWTKLITPPKK